MIYRPSTSKQRRENLNLTKGLDDSGKNDKFNTKRRRHFDIVVYWTNMKYRSWTSIQKREK